MNGNFEALQLEICIFANYLDIPTISIATALAFDPIETHTTFGMGKHLV